MDKEAFATVGGYRGGERMLHAAGTDITDHRILAYRFSPTVVVTDLLKKTTQLLLYWRIYLGQVRHKTMHMPGEDAYWGICCHNEAEPAPLPTVMFGGRRVAAGLTVRATTCLAIEERRREQSIVGAGDGGSSE